MYPISNALKAKFASNAKQYARITVGSTVIDNSRIRLGSFSVNRYALAEDTVVFGSCVAAEFNVTLENGDGAFSTGTFLGQEAFVEVGCDISGTVTYVPLGYFKFDMVTAQASALRLSALDRMMKFEKVVNPTPYSVSGTVSALIDTVCTACGVPRGTFTLPVNGTLALSGELTDVKTYRDILRWIGEVTGTIAYIGYDGKLYFGWYSGTEDFSVDPSNRAQGSISDDATTITSVSIVQGENMVTAGTGAKIVIRDNALIPLASATAQTIANNLYNHVNGFTYRTFEAGVFPMPHIAPLDCGVYSDLDGNDFDVCCTDWTFTLNANTKIAGKGGKQAYGRGYTLDESVFTARNIAAGAVTAEKIDVQDLAALRATIAGWNIGTEALYKEVTSGGYTYRVELCAPASISPNTQCITVKRKATGSSTWEIIDTTTYGGQHTAKDFIANGRVQIAPDYDLQEAGVYAVDLINNTTGYRTVLNPDFANFATNPATGSGVHIDDAHVRLANDDTSASASSARVEFENYGVGNTGVRVAEGAVGTSGYKESYMGADELVVSNKDILRTHQSLIGGWFINGDITANSDLNTAAYLKIGRWECTTAVAATLTNCPVATEFMMTVETITGRTIDDENGTWKYRYRRLRTYRGDEWVQFCSTAGTAGVWTYGTWLAVLAGNTGYSNSDLNNLTSAGIFVNGGSNSNAPQQWSGLLVAARTGYSQWGIHQLSFNNNGVFVRSYTGSPAAWTAWRQLQYADNTIGWATNAYQLRNQDTRNTNPTPNEIIAEGATRRYSMTYDFKSKSAIGRGSSGFTNLFNICPWGDSSGGLPVQISIDNGGDMALRYPTSNGSSWYDWQKVCTDYRQTITPTRNTTNTSSGSSVSVQLQGYIAYVNKVTVVPTSSGVANGATLFTGFPKPTETIRFCIVKTGATSSVFQCIIDTDGNMKMDTSGATANVYYYANFCYPYKP